MAIETLQSCRLTASECLGPLQACRDPELLDLFRIPDYPVSDIFHTVRDKDAREPLKVIQILRNPVETGQRGTVAEHSHAVFVRVGHQGATCLACDLCQRLTVKSGIPNLVVLRQFSFREARVFICQSLIGFGYASEYRTFQFDGTVDLERGKSPVILEHPQRETLREDSRNTYDIVGNTGGEMPASRVQTDDGPASCGSSF